MPYLRNAESTIEDRFKFWEWITGLTEFQSQRLIWVDEHSFNLWTTKSYARAPTTERANVKVVGVGGKGPSINNFLAISQEYGKIYLMVQLFGYFNFVQNLILGHQNLFINSC